MYLLFVHFFFKENVHDFFVFVAYVVAHWQSRLVHDLFF